MAKSVRISSPANRNQPAAHRAVRNSTCNAVGKALPISALPLSALFCGLFFAQSSIAQQGAGEANQGASNKTELAEDAVAPGATEINLKNAEISSIIRIFSRKTGRNYILDENVKGKVTIYLPGKVQAGEALKILDSLLALKGFTSVPIGDNLWKIVPNKDAKTSTIPTLQGVEGEQSPSAAMVTRIVGLKHSSADDVKQLVTPLVSPEGLLNAYTGTNSLIIIDSQDNIDRVVGIINTLDVPSSDRELTIIPVNNAEATTIAEKLNEILGVNTGKESESSSLDLLRSRVQEGLFNASNKAANSGGGGQSPSFAGGKTVTARTREPKITADERTNSVLVIADEETTARVRALIAQLDSKLDRSGSKFYVYRCQHASAGELAEVLGALGGGESGASSSAGSRQGADFFGSNSQNSGRGGLGTSVNNSSRSRARNAGQTRTPGQPRSNSQDKAATASASLGENISITADTATNSLVIFASKPDYLKVRELLSQLDVKRRQVLVEATLLEVAIDGALSAGVSFLGSTGGSDGGAIIKNDNGDLSQLLRDPTSLQNFSIAAASAGTLTLPGGVTIPTQSVLLSAAQSNRNVNVLSAPTILTTDNEEAEIVVGQNVPFISSTSSNEENLNNTFNQVDRQDVGITLRLTPQISSGDFVTLKIFTEVSAIIPGTASSELGPTTTVRTSDTTVITKDDQMVVIGGLMSDDLSDGESGIPYLKEIPVLGHLFKQNNSAHRRTNLLILITPRIIKDQYDHREVTVDARDTIDTEMKANPEGPDRSKVLYSDSISNVAETKVIDGPKPSTILPPVSLSPGAASSPTAVEPLKLQEGSNGKEQLKGQQVKRNETGALELRVKPKAPKVTTPPPAVAASVVETSPAPDSSSPAKANTKSRSTTNGSKSSSTTEAASAGISAPIPAVASSGERFVVLELKSGAKSSLPVQDGALVVMIPEGAPESAATFFAAGQDLSYGSLSSPTGAAPFKSLGVFTTLDQAQKVLPASFKGARAEGVYRLSPHELLNLGKLPWSATK